jgi:hypothetical protein
MKNVKSNDTQNLKSSFRFDIICGKAVFNTNTDEGLPGIWPLVMYFLAWNQRGEWFWKGNQLLAAATGRGML